MEPGLARRLWHVLRAVCEMLRRGLCRKRLVMDLHLLLGRGKLAGKALRHLLLLAHPHPHGRHLAAASSSAAALTSFYGHQREVEFSCTTTPSYPHGFFPFKNRPRGRGSGGSEYGDLDAAAVARAFEMMSAELEAGGGGTPAVAGVATPSPMVAWILGRSPAGTRPLRVTDSPFPAVPEDGAGDERVDAEAEEFIRRFYEQLRMQQSAAATPECRPRRRG